MQALTSLSNTVFKTGKDVYYAGLGVVATVTDNSKKVFDNLVEKGETASKKEEGEEKAKPMAGITSRIKGVADKATDRVQDGFSSTLSRMGIVTHDEVNQLRTSIEQLTERLQARQEVAS